MSTAEYLASSMKIDNQGIHVLLWDEKDDLVRALIVYFAAIKVLKTHVMLLDSSKIAENILRSLFEIRPIEEESDAEIDNVKMPKREVILILFIQQASSDTIGPLLNGWRNALSDKPGTLIVVRNADLIHFQRSAPDLFSFIGPKIFDCSNMLSIWTESTFKEIQIPMDPAVLQIIEKLPGESVNWTEIDSWLINHPPIDGNERQNG